MDETDKRLSEILTAEYFGTVLIALYSGLSFNNPIESPTLKLFRDLFGIFIAILLMRKISGAYFNPGVFVMFVKLRNSAFLKRHLFSYISTQFLGATSGFLLYSHLTLGNISVPCDINSISYTTCFIGEFISCFVFYLLIIVMGDPDYKISDNPVYSTFSIFCGIGCGCALGGNLSGASMNPSNATGALFLAFLNTGNLKYLSIGFVYAATPVFAAISVANFYVEIMKNGKNPFEDKKVERKLKVDF